MTSKRQKSTEESPEETSNVKSLPKVPESEVQEFKSMYLFKSAGTGKVLEVSDSSKKQAEELFASLDISLIDLPTGADWPVLPLVTPEGLLVHFVEKSAVLAVQSRGVTSEKFDAVLLSSIIKHKGKVFVVCTDPSHLSGQKHSRCGEE